MKAWLRKKTCQVAAWGQANLRCERGDTNFISILIVLGIVILVAGVFIGFKNQIVGQVEAIVNGFQIDSKAMPT